MGLEVSRQCSSIYGAREFPKESLPDEVVARVENENQQTKAQETQELTISATHWHEPYRRIFHTLDGENRGIVSLGSFCDMCNTDVEAKHFLSIQHIDYEGKQADVQRSEEILIGSRDSQLTWDEFLTHFESRRPASTAQFPRVPVDHIKVMMDVFKKVNIDNSGTVSAAEFCAALGKDDEMQRLADEVVTSGCDGDTYSYLISELAVSPVASEKLKFNDFLHFIARRQMGKSNIDLVHERLAEAAPRDPLALGEAGTEMHMELPPGMDAPPNSGMLDVHDPGNTGTNSFDDDDDLLTGVRDMSASQLSDDMGPGAEEPGAMAAGNSASSLVGPEPGATSSASLATHTIPEADPGDEKQKDDSKRQRDNVDSSDEEAEVEEKKNSSEEAENERDLDMAHQIEAQQRPPASVNGAPTDAAKTDETEHKGDVVSDSLADKKTEAPAPVATESAVAEDDDLGVNAEEASELRALQEKIRIQHEEEEAEAEKERLEAEARAEAAAAEEAARVKAEAEAEAARAKAEADAAAAKAEEEAQAKAKADAEEEAARKEAEDKAKSAAAEKAKEDANQQAEADVEEEENQEDRQVSVSEDSAAPPPPAPDDSEISMSEAPPPPAPDDSGPINPDSIAPPPPGGPQDIPSVSVGGPPPGPPPEEDSDAEGPEGPEGPEDDDDPAPPPPR